MSDTSSNNKRIAKNTLLLYFRMLLIMGVSLYTSRVILDALGVEDFGIYNVVGGVVALFNLLSGSLSAAISRFITFEMGKSEETTESNLAKIFSSSVTIQLLLCLVLLVFAETVGLCFLNYKMTIATERILAANWVYQFSILTFCVNLISIPYNATIIAHERMSAFAYISVIEALGKLTIAYLVVISPVDRLIFYALLMMLLSVVVRACYSWYCKKHFSECHYHFLFDKELLKQMFEFAGWNFIGASSAVLKDQGVNVILNMFFGPTVNAARGIALQVNGAVMGFVQNFMVPLNPQITKSYAGGDVEYMFKLVFNGARISFYLLLLLSLPILLNTQYVLSLWLKDVPEHACLFIQLILVLSLSDCISIPLITVMLATGNIRNYQIVVGGLQTLNLPISYLLLSLGAEPEYVVIVAIVISQCCLFARLYMLRGMIGLNVSDYMKRVYMNVVVVSFASVIFPLIIGRQMEVGLMGFLSVSIISIVSVLCASLFIGSSVQERNFIFQKAKVLMHKL